MFDETISASVSKQELTEKYFNMIYKLALSQTKDKQHAEDVCQDVFLKFLSSDKEFTSEEHAKAWLIRVAINASKSIFTSSWFKKTVPLSEGENIAFETKEESNVFYAVADLPFKYKTVIHLFYEVNTYFWIMSVNILQNTPFSRHQVKWVKVFWFHLQLTVILS